LKKLYFSIFFALCFFQLTAQNTWSSIAPFGGGERERGVAFVIGGRAYVGTGIDSANLCRSDIWEYDPGTNSWTQKANLPGPGRRDAIAFTIGSRGYVGTGINTILAFTGTKRRDLYEYNPITNTWTAKDNWPGNFNGGVYYASAFSAGDKGYLVCGKYGPSYYSDELWEYNPAVNDWAQKQSIPGGTRYGVTAFSISGKGYVGCGSDENYFLNNFYEYDPQTDEWTEKASFPGSPRFNAVGLAISGRGYIGMGTDGGYQKDFYEYNPATDTWLQKASLPGSERRSCVAFTIGGYGYVGTGKGPDGVKRSMYKYKPYFLFDNPNDNQRIVATVSPNPIQQQANITLKNIIPEKSTLNVFDMNGISVYQDENYAATSFTFNRKGLADGIYFYEITVMENNEKHYLSGKLYLQ
jgi:N-acetylneuraminic acid mutarotase